MRNERFNRMVAWFENLAMSVSDILRTPEPVLVPVRNRGVSERVRVERSKLLARTWPRLPPLG